MELLSYGAVELATAIKEGKATAVEAMEAVLSRIDAMEEKINAYVTIDRDAALEEAQEAQKKIEAGVLTGKSEAKRS